MVVLVDAVRMVAARAAALSTPVADDDGLDMMMAAVLDWLRVRTL